jgi:predicted membrane protein
MKTEFVSGSVLLGAILVFLGVLLIIGIVFRVSIPIFKILFALLLIYFGVKLLTGASVFKKDKNTLMLEKGVIEYNADFKNYNVIAANGIIDLSGIKLSSDTVNVEVNVVTGFGTVKVDSEMPVKVVVNSVLSAPKLPDGSVIPFGRYVYKSKNFKEDEKHLAIAVNAVFSKFEAVFAPERQ